MIDVHVHILPGIDDGASDIFESLEMAELAYESGVDRLVVTPHSNQMGRFENFYSTELCESFENLKKAVEEENLPLRLYQGMEIFATEDMCEKIEGGRLRGLNGKSVYLMEFPFDAPYEWITDRLEEVRDLNKRPLIAHPERYFCVQEYPGFVYEWIKMGCYTQVNKGSVFGKFGRQAAMAAEALLFNDLATCIASDAHTSTIRTTKMKNIWECISHFHGEDMAYVLLEENPRKILAGERIGPHGRLPERRKMYFNR